MTLWERLKSVGVFKRDEQSDVTAECARFANDQAYKQYLDSAMFNIILQLQALNEEDVEQFQALKRCQQALEGLTDYIEQSIVSEMMKNR